jgi:tRNA-dihydrouridine synthase A
MMDVTYRDYRQFMRILTSRMQLWTEMVVDSTLRFSQFHGKPLGRFLDFGENEHPIVCQLGGSDPSNLAEACKIVETWGYDEVNLNCGCPSDRVSTKGEFGASLMKKPELVRDCVHAMSRAVQIPVTVKTRLGVDEFDSPEFSSTFVRTVAQGGVKHFIIHARKAWLQGLSPAQNRSIPPLMYDRVVRLCNEFPDLEFSLNGGILSLEHVKGVLASAPANLQGVMLGRATYDNPCLLWDADTSLYGAKSNPLSETRTRRAIAEAYCRYLEDSRSGGDDVPKPAAAGSKSHLALKPILGLFCGLPGNRLFRRSIEQNLRNKELSAEGPATVLRASIATVADQQAGVLDQPLAPTSAAVRLDSNLSKFVAAEAEPAEASGEDKAQ